MEISDLIHLLRIKISYIVLPSFFFLGDVEIKFQSILASLRISIWTILLFFLLLGFRQRWILISSKEIVLQFAHVQATPF